MESQGKQRAIQTPQTLAECVERLIEITTYLRGPDGCPWDRKQTHHSLRTALIEECYEVVDAIESGDASNLREELGDLLLHSLLHSQIAAEAGEFTFTDVMRDLHGKLVRRHPHVFSDQQADDAESVIKVWEQVKSSEKQERKSAMDGIPSGMPSLMRAEKAGKKAARSGFDWPDIHGVLDKICEETKEIEHALNSGDSESAAAELGDLLFSAANLARHLKSESELLLHQATDKFIKRFQKLEQSLRSRDRTLDSCTLDELEQVWQEVKATEV